MRKFKTPARKRRMERDRLRKKRANARYLKTELERNGKRMVALHLKRRREGKCADCDLPSKSYRCPKHHEQNRQCSLRHDRKAA